MLAKLEVVLLVHRFKTKSCSHRVGVVRLQSRDELHASPRPVPHSSVGLRYICQKCSTSCSANSHVPSCPCVTEDARGRHLSTWLMIHRCGYTGVSQHWRLRDQVVECRCYGST